MNWIKISDVTPNSPREVLLYAETKDDMAETEHHYIIGVLGGSKNAPEISIQVYDPDGIPDLEYRHTHLPPTKTFRIPATHWCELTNPYQYHGGD